MCAGFADVMLPDHLPSGNQKRFWGDPDRAGPICIVYRSPLTFWQH
jgi:hypothetical protein